MPFSLYRSTLLNRMQNSSVLDGLISYVLKPRENGCPLSLWVAERVAERRLLNDDGIEMGEDTWLELVLAFVTADERQTLRVPARDQRTENGEAAGYDVVALQLALTACDPNNFKKFHQANCLDPVAIRVIALDKLSVPGDRAKKGARLEVHAAQKVPAKASAAGRTDKVPALPQKGGSPDKELFATFPEKSLRRRLWEAISSKKCVRCNGDHLRAACPKERQAWEDDFEGPDFWTKKFSPPKQARVQLEPYVNRPCLQVLHIVCSAGLCLCLIDTCSDVSMARRDVLTAIGMGETAVVIAHLGGETSLQEIGTFTLEAELAVLCNVFAVNTEELPARRVVALIGVSDVRRLGLSLDRIAARPACSLEEARALSVTGRLLAGFRSFGARVARFFCPHPAPRTLPAPRLVDIELPSRGAVQPEGRPALPALQSEERGRFLELFRPTLDQIKARSWHDQQTRTRARINRLYRASPPAPRHLPPRSQSRIGQSSSSSSQPLFHSPRSPSPESLKPFLPRRGKRLSFMEFELGARLPSLIHGTNAAPWWTASAIASFAPSTPMRRQRITLQMDGRIGKSTG
jgi:hypothetical protein